MRNEGSCYSLLVTENLNIMKSDRKKQLEAFERVLDVMETLREKCPWDRKQTFDSLRCNTIEETYELVDAIQQLDMPNIKKELGDVLLHIVFYALMAQEKDEFDAPTGSLPWMSCCGSGRRSPTASVIWAAMCGMSGPRRMEPSARPMVTSWA